MLYVTPVSQCEGRGGSCCSASITVAVGAFAYQPGRKRGEEQGEEEEEEDHLSAVVVKAGLSDLAQARAVAQSPWRF